MTILRSMWRWAMRHKVAAGIIAIVVIVGVSRYLLRPIAAPSAPVADAVAALTSEQTSAQARRFTIDNQASTVVFELDELLRNTPKHVVGTSHEIAGQIAVTPGDAPAIVVGDLAINARTLETDSNNRNAAMGRFILRSEEPANEFIMLTQVHSAALPAAIVLGVPFSAELAGMLTIAGVTKPVTFAARDIVVTETALTGTATATVKRSDFGLEIPSVPSVANVTDEVLLTVNLVAKAQ